MANAGSGDSAPFGPPSLVWLLDMLYPLWDKKRQTLHDKVAGSVVLRLRPGGWPAG